MRLVARRKMWYAVGKINGVLYRASTGFPLASGRQSKQNAQRRLVEIENAIRAGRHHWVKDPAPTLEQYWTRTYRPVYSQRKRAPERDDQVMAHAIPALGFMPLDEVRKSDCERYLNDRRQATQANPRRKAPGRIAEGTVQRERSFLHALFQQAVEDGVIERNPWRKIERTAYAVRERLLTADEQVELLSRLSPRFQRFVLFLLGTGVRLEECRGIDPATDLQLEARLVTVTGKFGKTRQVPLPAELIPTIQLQVAEDGALWTQNPQRLREVLTHACRGVEPSPDGTRRQYQRKAQTAIPPVGPHTLRHTFGWRWLKGGGDIYALSKVLGHASVAVTERHYAHLLKEDLRTKADAIDLGLGLRPKGKVLQMGRRRGSQQGVTRARAK